MGTKATPLSPEFTTRTPRVTAGGGSRWRQAGFWRAVMGMALALAIGWGAVVTEMFSESGHRLSFIRQRAVSLQARIDQMQERLTRANREVAEIRRADAAREKFKRILANPGSRRIRLEVIGHHPELSGVLALAPRLSAAVLAVTELPVPGPKQHYEVWWIPHKGAPLAAGDLVLSEPQHGDAIAQLVPPHPETIAIEVQLANAPPGGGAGGTAIAPILRGELGSGVAH